MKSFLKWVEDNFDLIVVGAIVVVCFRISQLQEQVYELEQYIEHAQKAVIVLSEKIENDRQSH